MSRSTEAEHRAALQRDKDRRDQFTAIHCRPATEQDYDAWLSGYRARGGTATIARFRNNWFVLSRDPAFLPEMYGPASIHLIVPAGMRVDGPRTFHGSSGHNNIYYMDGYVTDVERTQSPEPVASASAANAPCPPRARCGIDWTGDPSADRAILAAWARASLPPLPPRPVEARGDIWSTLAALSWLAIFAALIVSIASAILIVSVASAIQGGAR